MKPKTKKKTTKQWEKELKKLLKEQTKDTLKTAPISKLRAIRSAYYHIPAADRKKLSSRVSELSKQAEAIRKGTERAASNVVKNTKYKEAPQTKERRAKSNKPIDISQFSNISIPDIPQPKTPEVEKLSKILEPFSRVEDDIPELSPINLDDYDKVVRRSKVEEFIASLNLREKHLTEKMEILRREASLRGFNIQTLNLSDPIQIANQINYLITGEITARIERKWTEYKENYYNSGKSDQTIKDVSELLDRYMIARNEGNEEIVNNIYSYIYNIYEYLISITQFDYAAPSEDLFSLADDVESLLNGAVSELNRKSLKEVYEPEEILSASSLDLFNI